MDGLTDELMMLIALSVSMAIETDPARLANMRVMQLKLLKVTHPRITDYLTSVEIPP